MKKELAILLLLPGCLEIEPGASQADVVDLEVSGMRFLLQQTGDRMIAVRKNFLRRPDINRVGLAAELAMEQQSGCTVMTLQGDVARIIGTLDCTRPSVSDEHATWVSPRRGNRGRLFP